MSTEKSSILKQKIETGATFDVVREDSGGSSELATAIVGQVLTEHYDTKANVTCANESPGSMGELIKKYGREKRGYLYLINEETPCVVLLDMTATLAASRWAHERVFLEEAPKDDEKISTIDQHLAGLLAKKIVQGLHAGDDDEALAAAKDEVTLDEVSGDASRFMIDDDRASAMAFTMEGVTIDEAPLGAVTLLAPDSLFAEGEDQEDSSLKEQAARKWAIDMAKLAGGTMIDAKAVIAKQEIDLMALTNISPGHVIPLRGASLDAVALRPQSQIDGPSLALGAVRSHEGLRTMQVATLDQNAPGKV